ncbi:oligosaccharide flippase family protein [Neobacillus sp. MER 74]|uniref:lipopolysaccharide biosynthesis protein n=1 Tax=Neobacillus sp. MER 74 TaxID=2939566 RepID=UPI002041690E|nr:oligosaccharide flippase family protein [Neobacillus sp. MER 74]MCM3118460.1 oligosaccharide flippase family protein [Neobacillus sp. MER 74]
MRTKNSIKNTAYGIAGQLIGTILSFISRTLFINILGASYLGINGLFTNILSMLSLAELGVGSAIIYTMYKPLAEKDQTKIKALMRFYATAYKMIGCIVALLGLILLPFLDYLIKDKPNIPNLTVIYLMFLTNSVVTYFFAYKRSIITADQKNYLNTINQVRFMFIQNIIQITLLILTKNYILYLSVQIICSFISNVSISKKVDKIYPFLNIGKKEYLDKDNKKEIFKNIRAMMSHKIGGVVVNGTDNLLISTYVGVYFVGLYSNYIMIISIINSFIYQAFTAVTASIGNLNALEGKEKSYKIFNDVFFINFWLYGFCSISLWILLNPFIGMWIGNKYIMDNYIVLMIVINFFITGMRQTVIAYNSTLGLFWNDRFKPWFEAIINLIASIILLNRLGIVGVFLGTFISTITTSFWVEPYILYKHAFKKGLNIYMKKYALYTLVTIIAAILTQLACSVITTYTFISIVGRGLICFIIPNLIFAMFFYRTSEFIYLKKILVSLTSKFVVRIR